MYSKNLKQGFGFYTVEEFVRINKREEIDTANYFFIVCVLGSSFQYIYGDKKRTLLHNHALYIAPNKIFRFVNTTDRENIVIVFTKDRKSTRLNSSHVKISYADFCLKNNLKSDLRLESVSP